jgi:hypothetical protein
MEMKIGRYPPSTTHHQLPYQPQTSPSNQELTLYQRLIPQQTQTRHHCHCYQHTVSPKQNRENPNFVIIIIIVIIIVTVCYQYSPTSPTTSTPDDAATAAGPADYIDGEIDDDEALCWYYVSVA